MMLTYFPGKNTRSYSDLEKVTDVTQRELKCIKHKLVEKSLCQDSRIYTVISHGKLDQQICDKMHQITNER